jgi:aspartyl-tRNA(Asn)/glutamyl-tRNA(Gln) amidotransferase subunit C
VAVTLEDVHHIAALARLGLSDERARALVAELNTILAHMDALSSVDTTAVLDVVPPNAGGVPQSSRADDGPPIPLGRARETFAPAMRDGFFLVPRLATHEDAGGDEAAS